MLSSLPLVWATVLSCAFAWPVKLDLGPTEEIIKLEAWQSIFNTLSYYCHSIDSKSWDQLQDVFAEEGVCYDLSDDGPVKTEKGIQDYLEKATVNVHSQHVLGSAKIDIEDERHATSESYYYATFFNMTDPTKDIFHMGKYYDTWENFGSLDSMKWLITNRTYFDWQ